MKFSPPSVFILKVLQLYVWVQQNLSKIMHALRQCVNSMHQLVLCMQHTTISGLVPLIKCMGSTLWLDGRHNLGSINALLCTRFGQPNNGHFSEFRSLFILFLYYSQKALFPKKWQTFWDSGSILEQQIQFMRNGSDQNNLHMYKLEGENKSTFWWRT